jgi:hypothetical protein
MRLFFNAPERHYSFLFTTPCSSAFRSFKRRTAQFIKGKNPSSLMLRFFIACLLSTSLLAAPPSAFFEQHCYDCHDADTKKGDLDLTSLTLDAQHLDLWIKVHDAVERGEMPPKKKKQPAESDKSGFLNDLDSKLTSLVRADEHGRVRMRRMTRMEFQNTLNILTVDERVSRLGLRLQKLYGLWTCDSIQLGSATLLQLEYPKVQFVSLDKKLTHAASQEGFVSSA